MKLTSSYYLNLDADVHRKDLLLKEMKKLNLNPKRVPGINGKELTQDQKNELTGGSRWSQFIPDAVLGIAASHIKAWKTMIKNGDKAALICEDDVYFSDNAEEIFKKILRDLPENFDLVYLGCQTLDNPFMSVFIPIFSGTALSYGIFQNRTPHRFSKHLKIPGFATFAHAYILSAKGAKQLIKEIENNIGHQVDAHMAAASSKLKMRVFEADPHIAFQIQKISDSSQMNSSSNIYPAIINNALDKIQFPLDNSGDDISIGWVLTNPIFRIEGYTVTPWTGIFLLIGILFAIFKLDMTIILKIASIFMISDFLISKPIKPVDYMFSAGISLVLLAGPSLFRKNEKLT